MSIEGFMGPSNFEFIEEEISDLETCKKAVGSINYISHEAVSIDFGAEFRGRSGNLE